MTETRLSFKEMCAKFDVTPRPLRFYEAKELLFLSHSGQKRLFTKRDQARLKLIIKGKRFGSSLEEMRRLFDVYDKGDNRQLQMTAAYQVAEERLLQPEEQRAGLDTAIAGLKEMMVWARDILKHFKCSPHS